MLLSYRISVSSLEAMRLDGSKVNGHELKVTLMTPNWVERAMEEIQGARSSAVTSTSSMSNVLLGEDLNIPTMTFSMDEGGLGNNLIS